MAWSAGDSTGSAFEYCYACECGGIALEAARGPVLFVCGAAEPHLHGRQNTMLLYNQASRDRSIGRLPVTCYGSNSEVCNFTNLVESALLHLFENAYVVCRN